MFFSELFNIILIINNYKLKYLNNFFMNILYCSQFYTVVRNVKRAHQIQESGEFQEFNDDVEYILDALKDNNPIGTR